MHIYRCFFILNGNVSFGKAYSCEILPVLPLKFALQNFFAFQVNEAIRPLQLFHDYNHSTRI